MNNIELTNIEVGDILLTYKGSNIIKWLKRLTGFRE